MASGNSCLLEISFLVLGCFLFKFAVCFFVFAFVISGVAFSASEFLDLRSCASKADCVLIDIDCGRVGVVHRKYSSYSLAPDGCDKSLDFSSEVLQFDFDCRDRQCILISKSKRGSARSRSR